MVFHDTLWPDFDRRDLWRAIEIYAARDRRYGGAVDRRRRPSARRRARCARGAERRPALGVSRRSSRRRCRRSPGCACTSTKPCSALTLSAQRSTAGPSTSTVRPQARQTRWWWWPGAAAAVDRLAVVGAQHVDLAVGGHRLQGAVDGGQADPSARRSRSRACRSWAEREVVGVAEQRRRRRRAAGSGGVPARSWSVPAVGRALRLRRAGGRVGVGLGAVLVVVAARAAACRWPSWR